MSYTALVLDESSQTRLWYAFRQVVALDWQKKCHHMTINMGNAAAGPAAALIGKAFDIKVISVAKDRSSQIPRAIAVAVETDCPSDNAVKHITIAVNTNGGGKAKHSNELTDWTPLEFPMYLRGVVMECL